MGIQQTLHTQHYTQHTLHIHIYVCLSCNVLLILVRRADGFVLMNATYLLTRYNTHVVLIYKKCPSTAVKTSYRVSLKKVIIVRIWIFFNSNNSGQFFKCFFNSLKRKTNAFLECAWRVVVVHSLIDILKRIKKLVTQYTYILLYMGKQ